MESYWSSAASSTENPAIVDVMNNYQKIVFSRTIQESSWNNTNFIKENAAENISKLKQIHGKDIVIFGGAELASAFIKNNLIDEYRLIVNPVILGDGKALFLNKNEQKNLKLVELKKFDCANVLLIYKPV